MAKGRGREDARDEPVAPHDLLSAAETRRARGDDAARIRRLEERLRRQEEHYRALALAGGQMLWSTDADGLVVEVLPGWCAFTGQSPDEAHGAGWLTAVHPDDRARLDAEWRAARTAKQRSEYRFRARRNDGAYRWLLTSCMPVCDDNGDVREWIGACTDITEREAAEQARQVSDARAQQIIEYTPDGFFLADPDGYCVEANARAIAMLGYASREDVAGRSLLDLIAPDETLALEKALQIMRAGGTDVREWRLKRADGTLLVVEIRANLLPDGCWQGFIRDLTEPRRLEREAAARAAQMEAILDAMSDGVFVYDAHGRAMRVNAAARRLFALDADPAYFTQLPEERERLLNVRDADGRPLSLDHWGLLHILAGGVATSELAEDITVRRLDGHDVRLSVAGGPVRDDSGRVIGAVVVMRDVTERRLLEQRTLDTVNAVLALAGAVISPQEVAPPTSPVAADVTAPSPSPMSAIGHIAALTAQAVGATRVAVATVDPETEIMRPVTLVGFTPAEGARWWAGWAPGTTVTDRMGAGVAQRLRAGEVVQIDTKEQAARDRLEPYHVRTLFVVPMRVQERLIGALALDDAGVERAFTERDRLLAGAVGKLAALVVERERLLREREEAGAKALALEEANRRMDAFLSIAAHELKTPLTSMKVNVQITERWLRRLAEEAKRPDAEMRRLLVQAQDLVARVMTGLGRQDRLVDDLLDVSHIQTGKLHVRPERVDLCGIVRQIVEEQRATHPARVLSLDVPERPVRVDVDPDRVGQVVANFITNALKYAPPARAILVRLALVGRMARVSVRDQGPGIPPEQHARVWERFYRVPGISHLSGSDVGLGLGLFICREIVERHGGAVGVESAPGAGSTFWFELPLPPEAQ